MAGSGLCTCRLPDTSYLAPTLIPPGRELRFPEPVPCGTNPEQAAGASRAPRTRGSGPSPEEATLPRPTVRSKDQPSGNRARSGRSLAGFPGFKMTLWEPPGAFALAFPGWGLKDRKCLLHKPPALQPSAGRVAL